jgi:hypothetical protein
MPPTGGINLRAADRVWKKSSEIMVLRMDVLPLSKQRTLFEKSEKQSVSEHFTPYPYLSVARLHAKVFYLTYSREFIR